VDGVEVKDLDFGAKTVTVQLAPGTNAKAVVTALEDAGFGGSVND
jgi:hypothetical protein